MEQRQDPTARLPPTPSAYGFRNIKPQTRAQRRTLRDKAALEKSRLVERAGQAARQYRDNLPPEGVSLTELVPGAAGFIADSDRFHTDVAGEDYLRRQHMHERRVAATEQQRREMARREDARWQLMDQRTHDEEAHWRAERERGVKSKKNASGVPYDMISLRYSDGYDGQRLKYHDDMVKHRARVRANNLIRLGDTRGGFNILTGESRPEPVRPPAPHPPAFPAGGARHGA